MPHFAKIIHFLYIPVVVDFTWLFYTEIMIRIKKQYKKQYKKKGNGYEKEKIAVPRSFMEMEKHMVLTSSDWMRQVWIMTGIMHTTKIQGTALL